MEYCCKKVNQDSLDILIVQQTTFQRLYVLFPDKIDSVVPEAINLFYVLRSPHM